MPGDRDVELYLIHPDGAKIELSADNGGGGDNYGAGATNCGGMFAVTTRPCWPARWQLEITRRR